jgi:uncharacterized membrane protein YedE/YeeE
LWALIGGALIGIAASGLFYFKGRICGISGILATSLQDLKYHAWRIALVAGLLIGSVIVYSVNSDFFAYQVDLSWSQAILGGLLVGFGTRLGSGCTSGHGICGMARLSKRSIVATIIFMASGILTVYLTK